MNKASHDWNVQLNPALWAYRTSIHTPIGETPYSLVYGPEAILPLEAEIPSLGVSLKGIIPHEEYQVNRLQELEILDERRQRSFDHLKEY